MKQTTPAASPSRIEAIGPAKPEAGVTATSPATTPDTRPSSDGRPFVIHSTNIHARPAAAVATKGLIMAIMAVPLASRFEPQLNPNQPTHSRAAPVMVIVSECGAIGSLP